jgi:hypothetical protein
VRSVGRDELDELTAFSGDPAVNERLSAYLAGLMADELVHLDRCFVAVLDGAIVGRLVLSEFGSPNAHTLEFLDLPLEGD